ncbi:MAG: hypothetical protein Fur0046_21130 [Cyanobacteria bacterium J069]
MRVSHVAVYTLAALATQDVAQAAIAHSLQIDAPPMLAEAIATPTPAKDFRPTLAAAAIAPPEISPSLVGERIGSATFADESSPKQAIACPLPPPIAAIAPPEALNRAIAAAPPPLAAPLPQPALHSPNLPSSATAASVPAVLSLPTPQLQIAPPEPLLDEILSLQPPEPLFDPWIDPIELSRMEAELAQLQSQDDLWELFEDFSAAAAAGYWG